MNPNTVPIPFRLLLVEDNEHDRQAFRRAFRKSNVRIELTEYIRAEDALHQLKASPDAYHLIVSDHKLPGICGLDFYRELIKGNITLPMVLLTGVGSEHLAIEALKAGVNDYLIKDQEGGYLELLPVVLPEVWRQHQDRLAWQQAEEQLRKLSMAVEQSPVITMITDMHGTIDYVNPRFTRITGYTSEEAIGRNPRFLKSGKHSPEFYRELWNTILAGAEWWGELCNRKKDGSYYWELATILPIKDSQGQVTHLLKTAEDITQRKQMEEELATDRSSLAERVRRQTDELSKANAELDRTVRIKDEFLAIMSHELRTPLNIILGMSGALLEEVYGGLNERQLASIRRIEENGRHLLALITDILDLSEIGAGRIDLQLVDVPVQSVCQASLRFLQQTLYQKQLKISTMFDSAITTVYADERLIKQALVHLLSNAVKFTPEGGQIGLKVEGYPDKQSVAFTIWDTGIGIAREDMERLFLPFTQADSTLSRRYEGMGVGLSLVYRIAELHGGSITVSSEMNKGSQFTIRFPWQQREQYPTVTEGDMLPEPIGGSGKRLLSQPASALDLTKESLLILIAEDHDNTLSALSGYFTARGYPVIVARNGKEARQRVKEDRPALLILDMHMPEDHGLDVIRRIRASHEGVSLPIVAITSLALPGDRERCLAAGANKYYCKPLSPKELAEICEIFLREKTP